jgi:hypothetical protein
MSSVQRKPMTVLSMPEIGVDLPLSEIYEGITFPDAA